MKERKFTGKKDEQKYVVGKRYDAILSHFVENTIIR